MGKILTRRRKKKPTLDAPPEETEKSDKRRYAPMHGVIDGPTGRWCCPAHGPFLGSPRCVRRGTTIVAGDVCMYPRNLPPQRREIIKADWAEYDCSHAMHTVRMHWESGTFDRVTLGPDPKWYDTCPEYEFPVLTLLFKALREAQQSRHLRNP